MNESAHGSKADFQRPQDDRGLTPTRSSTLGVIRDARIEEHGESYGQDHGEEGTGRGSVTKQKRNELIKPN